MPAKASAPFWAYPALLGQIISPEIRMSETDEKEFNPSWDIQFIPSILVHFLPSLSRYSSASVENSSG